MREKDIIIIKYINILFLFKNKKKVKENEKKWRIIFQYFAVYIINIYIYNIIIFEISLQLTTKKKKKQNELGVINSITEC